MGRCCATSRCVVLCNGNPWGGCYRLEDTLQGGICRGDDALQGGISRRHKLSCCAAQWQQHAWMKKFFARDSVLQKGIHYRGDNTPQGGESTGETTCCKGLWGWEALHHTAKLCGVALSQKIVRLLGVASRHEIVWCCLAPKKCEASRHCIAPRNGEAARRCIVP